jgi:hypothetical protein
MMMKSLKLLVLFLFVATVAFCSFAWAKNEVVELKDIPLVWKPTEAVKAYEAIDLTAYQKATFTIKPFNDLRKDPAQIGENLEKRGNKQVFRVTTKDSVAAWLTDRFSKTLSEFDLDVVKNDGTFTLEADIVKFFVVEEAVYKAEVALKVRLRAKSGDVIWEGLASASSSRWGSSYKAENYYEALSNTTISVVHSLLKNTQFLEAVRKNK